MALAAEELPGAFGWGAGHRTLSRFNVRGGTLPYLPYRQTERQVPPTLPSSSLSALPGTRTAGPMLSDGHL